MHILKSQNISPNCPLQIRPIIFVIDLLQVQVIFYLSVTLACLDGT